ARPRPRPGEEAVRRAGRQAPAPRLAAAADLARARAARRAGGVRLHGGTAQLLPPGVLRRGRARDCRRAPSGGRGAGGRVHRERLPALARAAAAAHHRPEHGRQIDLHAPGCADRPHGARRLVRPGARGPPGADRPDLHAHRRRGRPRGRALDVHGRDDRERQHPAQRHGAQPRAHGRGRTRHLDLRRPRARLGDRAPSRREEPLDEPLRHALLRAHTARARLPRSGERAPRRGRAQGYGRVPARGRRRPRKPELRPAGRGARRHPEAGGEAGAQIPAAPRGIERLARRPVRPVLENDGGGKGTAARRGAGGTAEGQPGRAHAARGARAALPPEAPVKPLEGVRVVALEHFGAGPYGTMFLASLGADVIRVEKPGGGDPGRRVGPHLLGAEDSEYFQSWNLGKRSVSLDLKSQRQEFERLVAGADALANNLRGDLPAKLGLDYAGLARVNPALVCLHVSAYGRDNERAAWPGYDYLMQAEAGLMSLTGEPEGAPSRFGTSIIDCMTGMTGAAALLACLLRAKRTGKGCDV